MTKSSSTKKRNSKPSATQPIATTNDNTAQQAQPIQDCDLDMGTGQSHVEKSSQHGTAEQMSSNAESNEMSDEDDKVFKPNKNHLKDLVKDKALSYSIDASLVKDEELQKLKTITSPYTKRTAFHSLIQRFIPNSLVFKQNAPHRYSLYHEFDQVKHKLQSFIRLTFLETHKLEKVYEQMMMTNNFKIKADDIHGIHEIQTTYCITNVDCVAHEVVYHTVVNHLKQFPDLSETVFRRKLHHDFISTTNEVLVQANEKQIKLIADELKSDQLLVQLPLTQKPMQIQIFKAPTVRHCSNCRRTGHTKRNCTATDAVCGLCHKPDHERDQCPLRTEQASISQRVCVICRRTGHWATACEKTRWSTQPIHQTRPNNVHHSSSSSSSSSRPLQNVNSSPALGSNQVLSPILKQSNMTYAKSVSVGFLSPVASTHVSSKSQNEIIAQLQDENEIIKRDLQMLKQQVENSNKEMKQSLQQAQSNMTEEFNRVHNEITQDLKAQQEGHFQSIKSMLQEIANRNAPVPVTQKSNSPARKIPKKKMECHKDPSTTFSPHSWMEWLAQWTLS